MTFSKGMWIGQSLKIGYECWRQRNHDSKRRTPNCKRVGSSKKKQKIWRQGSLLVMMGAFTRQKQNCNPFGTIIENEHQKRIYQM